MKFNLYALWSDPVLYAAAAVFAAAMFFLVFFIRKYLEMKNMSGFEESGDETPGVQGELPLEAAQAGGDEASGAGPRDSGSETRGPGLESRDTESLPEAAAPVAPAPVPSLSKSGEPQGPSKAEEFVKGLYQNLTSLDDRLKNIEAAFSKANVNKDFTVTFLEDIIADFDSLDKEKIKARIEYLVSDLKK
jgi:hypothetical protein